MLQFFQSDRRVLVVLHFLLLQLLPEINFIQSTESKFQFDFYSLQVQVDPSLLMPEQDKMSHKNLFSLMLVTPVSPVGPAGPVMPMLPRGPSLPLSPLSPLNPVFPEVISTLVIKFDKYFGDLTLQTSFSFWSNSTWRSGRSRLTCHSLRQLNNDFH